MSKFRLFLLNIIYPKWLFHYIVCSKAKSHGKVKIRRYSTVNRGTVLGDQISIGGIHIVGKGNCYIGNYASDKKPRYCGGCEERQDGKRLRETNLNRIICKSQCVCNVREHNVKSCDNCSVSDKQCLLIIHFDSPLVLFIVRKVSN